MVGIDGGYDTIIVGSGIGGLVAGTYLAKSGFKTLILEQADKVGGYCGSFSRDGYRFDEAVHYINNFGPQGFLRSICQELGVEQLLQVLTIDPSDRLLIPGAQIAIYHDLFRTTEEFSRAFPKERRATKQFFNLVSAFNFAALYVTYQRRTFQELLDEYFENRGLKTALGLFATTMGLPADKLSALSALSYYKGSILDGGYHLVGGAQSFANALRDRFLQLGGEILLSKKVTRILVKQEAVRGVELEEGYHLSAKTIISNCDATQTFANLVGEEHVEPGFMRRLKALRPSASNLVVYLGIERSLRGEVPDCCNFWHFPYEDSAAGSINIVEDDRPNGFVHIGFSSLHDRTMAPEGCESLVLFCGASYMTVEYWREQRDRLADVLVERACHAIPQLRGGIRVKLQASPHTLFRYTLNRDGAYRGWEPTPDQAKLGLVPQKTGIRGLYLAGHWVTTPVGNGGVSMVAQSGKNAAKSVTKFLRCHTETVVRAATA